MLDNLCDFGVGVTVITGADSSRKTILLGLQQHSKYRIGISIGMSQCGRRCYHTGRDHSSSSRFAVLWIPKRGRDLVGNGRPMMPMMGLLFRRDFLSTCFMNQDVRRTSEIRRRRSTWLFGRLGKTVCLWTVGSCFTHHVSYWCLITYVSTANL